MLHRSIVRLGIALIIGIAFMTSANLTLPAAALPKFSLMEFLPAQRHVRTLYHYGVYVLELFRAAKAHTFVVKWGLFALTQFQGQENVRLSQQQSLMVT